MFGLDPLSRPVAITEMLLLLAFAAFVGWLIARLIFSGRVNGLRADLAERERELAECRQAKTKPVVMPSVATPSPSVTAPAPLAPAPVAVPAVAVEDVSLNQGFVAPAAVVPPALVPAVSVIDEAPAPVVAQGSEAAVLSRIASRANELNFDRIGFATAAEADDLKEIVGIGPFLERKLHSLGIYTFRQVANFTKEDIDKVNDIIEFFPGRIERDNWVGQSKVFYEKKYGA